MDDTENGQTRPLTVRSISGQSAQLELFCPPITITNDEAKRAHSGAITEQIICPALGITRIVPDSNCDVNYDGEGHGRFFEIKSVRTNSGCPIYLWRIAKDEATGLEPVYCFSTYTEGYKECDTYESMAESLQWKLDNLYLVPFRFVRDEIRSRKTYKNGNSTSGAGWNREGYADGYANLPVKRIKEEDFQRVLIREVSVWGFTYRVRINVHRDLNGLRRKIYRATAA